MASSGINFWSGALLRLGAILAALTVLPMAFDFLIFRGAATFIAALTLISVGPLAALCLLTGGILWLIARYKK